MNARNNIVELNIPHAVAGRFKIEAFKVDAQGEEIQGTRRLAADWFDNLVVDAGLDRMGSNSDYLSTCIVGSGSAAPAVGDTQLQSRVASTTAINSDTNGMVVSPRYGWKRKTFRFAAGAAAGNLSEVGIGWSSTAVFSRALILDGGGNPTTITVLSDEVLDVTYELRAYVNEADVSFNVVISGVTYACVLRPANIGGNQGLQLGDAITINTANRASGARSTESNVLGSVTGMPSGTQNSMDYTNKPYVNGTFYRSHVLTAQLNNSNFATGLGAVVVSNTFSDFQTSFTPKIPKDATKVLTLQVRSTWGRHVP